MNICIGIPSWLPDKEPNRTIRQESLNKLLKQLSYLWPELDILIIAQNWQNFTPIETKNKQIIKHFPQLGILQARKELRNLFLELNYDYIIMFDDDITIDCKTKNAAQDYLNKIKSHPKGFCFIQGKNSKYHPYLAAQLNLCAISRFIYEQEPMVDVDPQKNEGYEDSIFACLLHHKWSQYEFLPPPTIRPIHVIDYKSKIPSTWAEDKKPWYQLATNTDIIQDYIMKYKKFPENWKQMINKEPKQEKKETSTFYLYF